MLGSRLPGNRRRGTQEVKSRHTMRIRLRVLLAVIVALLLPFPGGIGYYPAGRALWDLAIGDVGEGPRSYWVLWATGVLAIYTGVVFLALTVVAVVREK
jgi:hypothetical protein